jgi:hypothetical protein
MDKKKMIFWGIVFLIGLMLVGCAGYYSGYGYYDYPYYDYGYGYYGYPYHYYGHEWGEHHRGGHEWGEHGEHHGGGERHYR